MTVLGVLIGGYLLIGLVWSSVVLFLSRGDGSTGGEMLLMFTAMIPLWPLAAFVVVPDVTMRAVRAIGRFFASASTVNDDDRSAR